MTNEVVLPALDEYVTEAQVTRWHKAVGDQVTEGDVLLEVTTDKADIEVPSPFTGVLQEIVADEDAEVSPGDVLGVIGDGSDSDTEPVDQADACD